MIQQNEMIEKNYNYIRYILFRYSLAIFLFSNVNWAFMHLATPTVAVISPLILIISILPAMFEQMKVYGKKEHKDSYLKYTKFYFVIQSCVNGVNLIAVIFRELFVRLFPLFTNQWEVKIAIGVINLVGLLISFYNLQKIQKMNGRDYDGNR
jgi:hypothetical protein